MICDRTIPHVMRDAEFDSWHASNPGPVAVRISARMDIDDSALAELTKETLAAIALVSFGENTELPDEITPQASEIARVTSASIAENLARRALGYNEHIHYSALRAAGCRVEPIIEFHPVSPECDDRRSKLICEGEATRTGGNAGAGQDSGRPENARKVALGQAAKHGRGGNTETGRENLAFVGQPRCKFFAQAFGRLYNICSTIVQSHGLASVEIERFQKVQKLVPMNAVRQAGDGCGGKSLKGVKLNVDVTHDFQQLFVRVLTVAIHYVSPVFGDADSALSRRGSATRTGSNASAGHSFAGGDA